MRIPLDGLDIKQGEYTLAQQAFDGTAEIEDDGSVGSIELRGFQEVVRGRQAVSRLFNIPKNSPLFQVISEAVERQYADRIRQWLNMPRGRSMADMNHRSNCLDEVA